MTMTTAISQPDLHLTPLQKVLDEFRQAKTSNRDMGDMFEKLIAGYLVTDPMYKDKFSDVWLWMEWPERKNRPDTGIDLVARERATGDYCAIQCKFYDPAYTLQKADIDSFFTASGKEPFTSRMIVSTTDKWSSHADDALKHQQVPVSRLRVQDLEDSPVDWGQFSLKRLTDMKLKDKKHLREHQKAALMAVEQGFQTSDRGKLIMACGTGKTFTALKIAEHLVSEGGTALFLVPSISLLSQTLREWTAEADRPLHSFAVCSDTKVGKRSESEDISTHDLAFPATTDGRKLAAQMRAYKDNKQFTVIFSTYQSIQAVAEAQKQGVPEFDLIICDEAHRTTGVTLDGEDESHFIKVHDSEFLKGKKRLYMTATPRIYTDDTKTKAQENDATLCSMDDVAYYGHELYRLGFSEAVNKGLLADYKVMVLAVDEKFVSKTFQAQIADANNELNLDDAVKITGCWNGLSKRMIDAESQGNLETDPSPMRRAVAFSRSIKDSKKITAMFSQIVEEYCRQNTEEDNLLTCEVDHVDGSFNALKRNELLDWLKADTGKENNCRILSNARCLSEGVDVPALDAVMFLNPRNSVVDVVQSVGRVMRRAEGKKYGYIILPIGIPAGMKAEEALKDNQKYKVVWQVLQALRAHDDRFNALINKIELNKAAPDQIQVIGVGASGDDSDEGTAKPTQLKINLPYIEEWRNALYGKIVLKCGDRRYWEVWAADVAQIAERHVARIKGLLKNADTPHRAAFDEFLASLQTTLNPSITEMDAIEMLAQHLITKPVFDALFKGYQFTQQNPVSLAMQRMLDLMEEQALEKETGSLEKFYDSVRAKASDIDNAQGRQTVIKELYEKFFKIAFPRLAKKMGIVYTPVDVVDFIIHSADAALKQEFGVGLAEKDVHVLDPFTGTGTFMVRLLQSGLISKEDLPRKYTQELHANEIVLLAYYIAAINIEETYHDIVGGDYHPFEGMVLTDTFQLSEGDGRMEGVFPANSERANRQRNKDIRVIIGNPPYAGGQESENDGNKNIDYPQLDERIRNTYATHSTATNKQSLYNSYVRAIRWASDRIKDKGIICYVTNGKFIDSNAMDGVRQSLANEFSSIYVFNLRGFIRGKAKDDAKREGQNVFDIMTGVAITLMVKNPDKQGPCQLFYHDIGDYLSRQQKLSLIKDYQNIQGIRWAPLAPNENYDWINHRDPAFVTFIPIGDKENKTAKTIFGTYSRGLETARDAWVYNFSKLKLVNHVGQMIDFYNSQVNAFQKVCKDLSKQDYPLIEDFIDRDPKKISWSRSLKADLSRFKKYHFDNNSLRYGMYRPFCKQNVYFNRQINNVVGQMPKMFPNSKMENLVICITSAGSRKPFSVLISSLLPDLNWFDGGNQCFPLNTYEPVEETAQTSLLEKVTEGYKKKDNISDSTLTEFRTVYGDASLTKEDIFYYVYGILNSPEYKHRFEADLKKMLPRIPMAQDFWAFSKAGRNLAHWHLNYETIEPYPLEEVSDTLQLDPQAYYKVEKMTFGKRQGEDKKSQVDKSTIIYNSHLKLSGIPLEAYDYVVNGKPALEWVMERYQKTKDKDSQITNDPNDWSDDPRYIVDLVKRIVRVSVESVQIINALPPLNERQ